MIYRELTTAERRDLDTGDEVYQSLNGAMIACRVIRFDGIRYLFPEVPDARMTAVRVTSAHTIYVGEK